MHAWERLVESEPRVIKLADAILRDHIPELVDQLAVWMELGVPPGTERMRLAAIDHATQRLEHGFELTQLLHEVRLLRMTILRHLLTAETAEQALATSEGLADRVTELARLNAGLDFVISDAVEYFVEERERRLLELATREVTVARESDQRKSAFLAVLSHELRNPLAPIVNALHILDRASPGTEQAGRAMDVIHRQTSHLTRLVDDLLDTTRMSHGKIELQREVLDLRDVVRRTFDDHRALFEQRRLTLSLQVPPGPVSINGDATRIAQVLSNLLNNAAKFTSPGGTVTVAIHTDDGRASLHVLDDGVGMEHTVVEQVFEPFVQGRQDAARQQGGLGLGLALVKGLVELHGGSVSAQSAGHNLGSEFVINLPLVVATPLAPQAFPQRPVTSRLVLIIEDNVDASDTLAQVLELNGHRTRVARDGKSGVALARELKPDVILCDIGLPDMDGYEVARVLHADGGLRATRLVALSGYVQPEDKERVKRAGFEAHLAKPPSLDQLNEILARELQP